jgi:hypothetical protein
MFGLGQMAKSGPQTMGLFENWGILMRNGLCMCKKYVGTNLHSFALQRAVSLVQLVVPSQLCKNALMKLTIFNVYSSEQHILAFGNWHVIKCTRALKHRPN